MKQIIQRHIEHFIDCEKTMTSNQLLIEASSYGLIEYIQKYLNIGANINFNDREDTSPLYHAICLDDLDAAEFLIKRGANINNPLGMIADLIYVEYDDFSLEYFNGNKELRELKKIKLLLKNGACINSLSVFGETPLEVAIKCKGIQKYVLDFLLENGANINLRNGQEKTILDIANESYPELINFLKEKEAKTSEELDE